MPGPKSVVCDYCGKDALKVSGSVIYPRRRELHHLFYFYCKPCEAYVGCHENSGKPLGRLADKELRHWKMRVHKQFDVLWKSGKMKRNDAYAELAKRMGIPVSEAHVGMFDIAKCKLACEMFPEETKPDYPKPIGRPNK